jgi:Arc/MetJ-type ribon-helix-helix transcriptional regulator
MNGEVIYAVLSGIITFVATFAVMRNNVTRLIETNKKQEAKIEELEKFKNENTPLLKFLKENTKNIESKFDEVNKLYYELKEKLSHFPTWEMVRQEFVSKEYMKQMEEMIKNRFDSESEVLKGLGATQKEMMEKLNDINVVVSEIKGHQDG